MYEDHAVELAAFGPGGRIFCIASAGCTALALAARGFSVTAVDVNPAQVAYLESRLAGGEERVGRVERRLRRARSLGPLVGWREAVLREFRSLADTEKQGRFWRERLDTRRFRAALGLALRPPLLRRAYAREFTAVLPRAFDRVVRRRLERGFLRHPNRDNPYARLLLLDEGLPVAPEGGLDVSLARADAADFLHAAPRGSFDGFALSNVLDGPGPAYARRLWDGVRQAAAPGAMLVLRSFAEPCSPAAAEWAARDRSLLWGSVRVERVEGR